MAAARRAAAAPSARGRTRRATSPCTSPALSLPRARALCRSLARSQSVARALVLMQVSSLRPQPSRLRCLFCVFDRQYARFRALASPQKVRSDITISRICSEKRNRPNFAYSPHPCFKLCKVAYNGGRAANNAGAQRVQAAKSRMRDAACTGAVAGTIVQLYVEVKKMVGVNDGPRTVHAASVV